MPHMTGKWDSACGAVQAVRLLCGAGGVRTGGCGARSLRTTLVVRKAGGDEEIVDLATETIEESSCGLSAAAELGLAGREHFIDGFLDQLDRDSRTDQRILF